jgi:hypothetical protein
MYCYALGWEQSLHSPHSLHFGAQLALFTPHFTAPLRSSPMMARQ